MEDVMMDFFVGDLADDDFFGSQSLEIRKVDITELEVDCIVNAANCNLRMGGGVCGAIFRKAGAKELMEACEKYGTCETGYSVLTQAFKLKAKYIAHAVGPVWRDGTYDEPSLLKNCYRDVIRRAKQAGCNSMAFPLISAGSFGYPAKEAWQIALSTILEYQDEHLTDSLEVTFAVIDDEMLALGNSVLESLKKREDYVFFWRDTEEYGYFSQWYPAEFEIEGIRYCHAEQYMMAKKAMLANDFENYILIMHETDPSECKRLGRAVRGLDVAKWDACKEEIVFHANLAKFSQDDDLRKKLLATKDKTIAEASATDTEWGIGLTADRLEATDPEKWRGRNMLGNVLMRVRDELKKESSDSKD